MDPTRVYVDTVRFCQDLFGFELPSALVVKRKVKFVDKLNSLPGTALLWTDCLRFTLVKYFS